MFGFIPFGAVPIHEIKMNDYLKIWIFPCFSGSLADAERCVVDSARRLGVSYEETLRGLYPHVRSGHMQTLAHQCFGNGYADHISAWPFELPV